MFDRRMVFVAVTGLVVLLSAGVVVADTAPVATYVGSGACKNCHGETSNFTGGSHPKTQLDCKMCHTARHASLVKSYFKSDHSTAFVDAEESPSLIAAQFTASSPVKKEQIAFILGTGTDKQAYLDAKLKVLPAQWNLKLQKWERVEPQMVSPVVKAGKGNSKLAKNIKPQKLASAVKAGNLSVKKEEKTEPIDGGKQCVGCHTTGYDPKTRQWDQPNVNCESCHGPGSLHKAAGDKTKITNPASLTPERQAMVCGQCHSKGTDKTKTYAFPVGFRPGDDLSKVFIDAKPKTPGMNQQYSEMLGGKHFANKVICTSCHDPHGPVQGTEHQLKKPINALCLDCHKDKDIAKHKPGMPADTTCAVCHMPGGAHVFKIK